MSGIGCFFSFDVGRSMFHFRRHLSKQLSAYTITQDICSPDPHFIGGEYKTVKPATFAFMPKKYYKITLSGGTEIHVFFQTTPQFELLDNKQALDLAIKDLNDNYEIYIERFMKWLKK